MARLTTGHGTLTQHPPTITMDKKVGTSRRSSVVLSFPARGHSGPAPNYAGRAVHLPELITTSPPPRGLQTQTSPSAPRGAAARNPISADLGTDALGTSAAVNACGGECATTYPAAVCSRARHRHAILTGSPLAVCANAQRSSAHPEERAPAPNPRTSALYVESACFCGS